MIIFVLMADFPIAAEEEPEDAAHRQRQKLAGTGLTSDEEDEPPAAGSGYESDDNQAEERQQSAEPLTGLSCIHNCNHSTRCICAVLLMPSAAAAH